MIKARNLSKSYGKQVIFKDFNIEINKGDIVGIVGKTGCGKSTLLNILSGYEKHYSGEVEIDGKNYKDFSEVEINNFRKQKIAFLFQSYNLLSELTVSENLKLSLNFDKSMYHLIDEYLNKLELEHLKDKKVANLSGGEKQRIAFLRALIKDFDILICDEPTGNLDDMNANLILDLIKEECSEKIVIMVTHKKSISSSFFNKLFTYNRKIRCFEETYYEPRVIKEKAKESRMMNTSIYGVLNHALSRLKVNKIYNLLFLLLIVMFTISYSATQVLSQGMFRQLQINNEEQFYPLQQMILENESGSIEELEKIDGVNVVETIDLGYENSKLDIKSYSGKFGELLLLSEYPQSSNLNDSAYAQIFNIEIDDIDGISRSYYSNNFAIDSKNIINYRTLSSEEQFPFSDLIVGSYPEDGEILLDVTTAVKMLSFPGIDYENYITGDISIEYIWNYIDEMEFEVYKVYDRYVGDDDEIYQNIEKKTFKISGIIDSKFISNYLQGIYLSKETLNDIQDFYQSEYFKTSYYTIYKDDSTASTHYEVLDSLPEGYVLRSEDHEALGAAYSRIRAMVDYNLFFSKVASIVFFAGFIFLVRYVFSHNGYEIAVYRSLGYSKKMTTFLLSLSYIVLCVLGAFLGWLTNKLVISKLLAYGYKFTSVFNQGVLVSAVTLVFVFYLILLYYVIVYSRKSINSIL